MLLLRIFDLYAICFDYSCDPAYNITEINFLEEFIMCAIAGQIFPAGIKAEKFRGTYEKMPLLSMQDFP